MDKLNGHFEDGRYMLDIDESSRVHVADNIFELVDEKKDFLVRLLVPIYQSIDQRNLLTRMDKQEGYIDDQEDLARLFGFKNPSAGNWKRFLKNILQKDIIREIQVDGETRYLLHPRIAHRGNFDEAFWKQLNE
ncbi:hypothetical protein SELR_pSRC500080 (plasmid) [Selenomonas ruminantium subsp. lactilytica TAM6421]|uniref:Uncharacterized protein n=2 Tax=Selenomonas ruminantium TaxID=971 RepID=I0GWP5_SELRL|nr:hypothetical protein SELR_pSRC500080 [Selenomonas ruminantium subsp. lactilytica TAM6421]